MSFVSTSVIADALKNTLDSIITDDALNEDNETVVLQLSDPHNAVLGSPVTHTLTILDDDPRPTVAFVSAASSSPRMTAVISPWMEIIASQKRSSSHFDSLSVGSNISVP